MMRRTACGLSLVVVATILLFELLPPPAVDAQAEGEALSDQNLAIIVNLSNPVNDLSMKELRQIFLGERSHWPNGHRITLVVMEPGTAERRAVLRQIYHMSEADFSRHFLHGLFTGEVFVSPKTLASPVGARKFVFNVPGAIGYVRASDVDASVKVVSIDGHLPDDKEYRLQIDPHSAK
jgi:ABC-type phosphate transport system substrate-binding protein